MASKRGRPKKNVYTSTPERCANDITGFSDVSVVNAATTQQLGFTRFPAVGGASRDNRTSSINTGVGGNKPLNEKNDPKKNKVDTKPGDRKYLEAHNALLQALFLEKMQHESHQVAEDDINKHLIEMQKRIDESYKTLHETKERIKKIETCREMQSRLDTYKMDFKNYADSISSNGPNNEQSKAIAEEIKKMRNQLNVKNVTVPHSKESLVEWNEILKDTAARFEKHLKIPAECIDKLKEIDSKLAEFENLDKKSDDLLESCANKLPSLNSTILSSGSKSVINKTNAFTMNEGIEDSKE